MILYDNQERLRLLLQAEGNVVVRIVPVGVVVGLLGLLCLYVKDALAVNIENPWGAKTLGITVSFAIVYRTQISWARYWEAATQLQLLYSKWADCFVQVTSFINTAERDLECKPATPEILEKMQNLAQLRYNFQHNFSLLSALSAHRLTHGDISRMCRISASLGIHTLLYPIKLVRHWKELVVTCQDLRFNDDIGAKSLPDFRVFYLESDFKQTIRAKMQKRTSTDKKAQLWAAVSFSPVSFSPKRGTQASGDDVGNRRSLASRSSNVTWSTDLAILGELSAEEKKQLTGGNDTQFACSNPDRVNIVLEWINEDLNESISLCGIPPPIMSRCYQELSNGMLAFCQAMNVADVPFPLPFAQLLEILLAVITCVTPMYTAIFTGGVIVTPILSCFITIGYWSLTEIARELENPFADTPNQLPVIDMHERFVELVQEVSSNRMQERRPGHSPFMHENS